MRGIGITAAGVVAVIIAVGAAIYDPVLALAVPALLVSFAIRRRPRVALLVWLASVYFVPFWTELHIGVNMPPPTFTAVFLIPAILTHIRVRLVAADWMFLVFFATCALAVFALDTPLNELAAIILQWAPAYIIGRTLAPAAGFDWAVKVIAVLTAIIGVWSVVEFAFHLHVFENYAGTSEYSWQSIQSRGPWERSEAAFGHSIALGAFLAIGTPFILKATMKPFTRIWFLIATGLGVFVTFSRAGQIAFVVAIVLSVIFMRESGTALSRNRIGWGIVTVVGLAIAVPFALSKFSEVSSDLDGSSAYRANLLDNLADLHPLGLADYFVFNPQQGRFMYRLLFGSIDNAPLLFGLTFGWIPLVILGAVLIGAALSMLRARASVATIAVIAVIPVIVTVALITQWAAGLLFFIGLAVAGNAKHAPTRQGQVGASGGRTLSVQKRYPAMTYRKR